MLRLRDILSLLQVTKLLNGQTLFGLVNNVGAAFYGPLMYQPIQEFRRNIEINLIGTLQVTQVRVNTSLLPLSNQCSRSTCLQKHTRLVNKTAAIF